MNHWNLPLALTMGDPAGIGGEIAVRAWASGRVRYPFYLIDAPSRIETIAAENATRVATIETPGQAVAAYAEALPILPLDLPAQVLPGNPAPTNAPSTIASIETAVFHVQSGEAAAIVTNPINKKALKEGAGFGFPGHTEFLAALAGGGCHPVMMLAGPELRVVPVTIHVALRDVPEQLTTELIIAAGRITHAGLVRDFGIAQPRIAVAGLNPHAGEGGTMGREEIEVIIPALEVLRAEGIDVAGPLSADTMFHAAARARYDAALCMYHDQALIPIKTLNFDQGVNVTLGLPFVRTSPDHGTAYDIAGTNTANPTSLIEALNLAGDMAAARARHG